MDRGERKIRYAVRRGLCWQCFEPLTEKSPTHYMLVCKCGAKYPMNILLKYREKYGYVGTAADRVEV